MRVFRRLTRNDQKVVAADDTPEDVSNVFDEIDAVLKTHVVSEFKLVFVFEQDRHAIFMDGFHGALHALQIAPLYVDFHKADQFLNVQAVDGDRADFSAFGGVVVDAVGTVGAELLEILNRKNQCFVFDIVYGAEGRNDFPVFVIGGDILLEYFIDKIVPPDWRTGCSFVRNWRRRPTRRFPALYIRSPSRRLPSRRSDWS